jgi:hypothetical protein
MDEQKHFYRTVIEFEILSEHPVAFNDLAQIHYAITEGDCSGISHVKSQEEVAPEKMARLLLAQGSDPSFFGLEEPTTCCVCGKPAKHPLSDSISRDGSIAIQNEDTCQCLCPKCGTHCYDDTTIPDHGMCNDCFKKWQYGQDKNNNGKVS